MADGSVTVADDAIKNRHIATAAAIARSKMAQRVLAPTGVLLTNLRTWDALATNLPGTPASDDLGLITGTWASGPNYVSSGDLKAAGATTRRAQVIIHLPADYEDAQTVTLRLNAGMITTVADTSATIDVEAWRIDSDGTLGAADLCATSAQSMNSLTANNYDFTLTPTTLTKGDSVAVRISIAVNDAATATAVTAALYAIQLLADLR